MYEAILFFYTDVQKEFDIYSARRGEDISKTYTVNKYELQKVNNDENDETILKRNVRYTNRFEYTTQIE